MRCKKSEAIPQSKKHGNSEYYHSDVKQLSSSSKPILCLTIIVVVLSQSKDGTNSSRTIHLCRSRSHLCQSLIAIEPAVQAH